MKKVHIHSVNLDSEKRHHRVAKVKLASAMIKLTKTSNRRPLE